MGFLRGLGLDGLIFMIRSDQKARMVKAFWLLVLHVKEQAYAKGLEALQEELKKTQEQMTASGEPAYSSSTCRACHAWSVLSSELNQTSKQALH